MAVQVSIDRPDASRQLVRGRNGHVRLPAYQGRSARLRERVETALDADKPAINISLKYLRRIWELALQIARPRRCMRQCRRTSQPLLPVSRHDRLAAVPPP